MRRVADVYPSNPGALAFAGVRELFHGRHVAGHDGRIRSVHRGDPQAIGQPARQFPLWQCHRDHRAFAEQVAKGLAAYGHDLRRVIERQRARHAGSRDLAL